MFFNAGELFTYLNRYYQRHGGEVDIASYNMYLGISKGTDWSQRYPLPARTFLDTVDKENLRLVVGMPPSIACTPGCEHCIENYVQLENRLIDTADRLELPMRVNETSHLKMYRVGDLMVVGGINLGGSSYTDVAMRVTSKKRKSAIQEAFDTLWSRSIPYEEYWDLEGA